MTHHVGRDRCPRDDRRRRQHAMVHADFAEEITAPHLGPGLTRHAHVGFTFGEHIKRVIAVALRYQSGAGGELSSSRLLAMISRSLPLSPANNGKDSSALHVGWPCRCPMVVQCWPSIRHLSSTVRQAWCLCVGG